MSSLRVFKIFVFINIISYCLYFFSELIKIRFSKYKVLNKDFGINRVSLFVKIYFVMMYFILVSLNLNVYVKILFFKMYKIKMNLLIVILCWDFDVFFLKNGK